MTYLIATAQHRDLATVQHTLPALWRQVRRYNLPVQLALAAAHTCAVHAHDIAHAALISLAPCQTGSADLYQWAHKVASLHQDGYIGAVRMNPTHTLHAIDNLALSTFAILHGNRGYGLGLGGAAGQAWVGFEVLHERLMDGMETEALLMAGDQEQSEGGEALGVALLFSSTCRPYAPLQRPVRLVEVQRQSLTEPVSPCSHAADGLAALLVHLEQHREQRFSYTIPLKHGDGIDQITLVLQTA